MKWCADCKTMHPEGAHTRPQPLPVTEETKQLRAEVKLLREQILKLTQEQLLDVPALQRELLVERTEHAKTKAKLRQAKTLVRSSAARVSLKKRAR